MSLVHWIFLVYFHQTAFLIVDFLIEPNCSLRSIYLFDVAGFPATEAEDFVEVAASSVGQLFP